MLFPLLLSCGMCSDVEKSELIKERSPNYFTEEQWNKLAGSRIFFGCQSVGRNIVDGAIDLQSETMNIQFVNIESLENSDCSSGFFLYSRIGENFNPISKIDDFVIILRNGLGNEVDIALMKLGYLDISRSTNLNSLFMYYRNSMDTLQNLYPDLRLIHCTVPLTTKLKGLKGLVKAILRMDYNDCRENYNNLIRSYYKPDEIFDIAKVQSELPDGSRYEYRNHFTGMIDYYSTDGGHLSQIGSLVVGRELIKTLLYAVE